MLRRTTGIAVSGLAVALLVGACSQEKPDTAAPAVPVEVSALASTSVSVHVMWRADADVETFEVYQGNLKVRDVTDGRHMVDVTGLAPGTAYSFSVRARDKAGNLSAPSAEVPATTLSAAKGEQVPPSAPGALRGQAEGPTTAVLSWTAARDDTGVTAYDVHQGGARVHSVAGDKTTAVVTGLQPGTDYSFTVTARDAADNSSPESGPVTLVTAQGAKDARSTAPIDLRAVARVASDGHYVDLTWMPPDVSRPPDTYEVYRDGQFLTTVLWGAQAPAGEAQYSLPLGDEPAGTHTLKIRARLPDGKWGDFSAEVTAAAR